MSTMRVRVCGASFVCRVDSTRWPVCAALMAISAVSRSRISPTMMTSGSWRRKERMAEAKVNPKEVDFRGILSGGDIRVLAVEDRETGVERHRLAAARRSGHEDHALRFRQVLEVELLLEGLVDERFDAELGLRGIENTQHDLLAEERRAGAHAEVDGAILRELHLDAPVLGHTPLRDVEARHDLEARGQLGGKN